MSIGAYNWDFAVFNNSCIVSTGLEFQPFQVASLVYLFISPHTQKKLHEKKERKQIRICARFKTTKKKTETKKLSDYINNIYGFARPYERYYSLVIVRMDITDINIIVRIYKWN